MLVTLRGQRVKQGKAYRKKSQTFHAKVMNIFWLKDVNVNVGKNITPLTTSFLSCFSSSMSSSSNKATRSPEKNCTLSRLYDEEKKRLLYRTVKCKVYFRSRQVFCCSVYSK